MDFKPQQTPPRRPEDSFGAQPNPDNEPETYVTPEGRPTTLGDAHVEPQVQPVAAVTPKKSGAKKWLVGGVFVLLLAGLGALVYWQWAEAQNAKQELTSVQTQLQTAQSDLAKAEKDDTKTTDETATPTAEELIIKTATANAQASMKGELLPVSVEVAKHNDKFAYVRVEISNGTAGEYVEILKKINDVWVVAYRGQEKPAQSIIDQYSIPVEYQFVPAS